MILQPLGNVVQGFVPGRTAPFAFAPLAGADERRLGAFVVVNESHPGAAPGANGSLDTRRMGISLNEVHAPFSTST